MIFKHLRLRTKLILILQSIGMLMGTSTHLGWVMQNGFLSEHYHVNLFSKVFWDSLTFLDPIAAILLIFKPKTGVIMTLIIILFDIIHNNLIYFDELYLNAPPLLEWITRYWMILGQLIFAGFVLVTFSKNILDIERVQKK